MSRLLPSVVCPYHRRLSSLGSGAAASPPLWRLDHLVYGVDDLQKGMARFEALTGVKPALGGRHDGLGTHNAIVSLGGGAYFEIIAPDPTQPTRPQWMGLGSAPHEALACGRLLTWAVRLTDEAEAVSTDPWLQTWIDDDMRMLGDYPRSQAFENALAAAAGRGYDAGEVRAFSRRAAAASATVERDATPPSPPPLRWSLAFRHYEWPLPSAGALPFLIHWEAASRARVLATAPTGATLTGLRASLADLTAAREASEALVALGGVRDLPGGVVHCPGSGGGADSGALACTLETPNGIVEL